jgi:diguanylate cyclase (GGDEF)-like protein/PAS domain S-box-containing protein
MKKRSQTALWIFLLPAILVASLGALMNLLLLKHLEVAQGERVSISTQQLALVSETTKLLEDLGLLHDEVASMLARAAKHELDEAGVYRVHRHVVNELAVLEQRVGSLQAKAGEFTGDAKFTVGFVEEFSAFRKATIMTTDIITIDPKRAKTFVSIAERRFLNISRYGHEVSRHLAEGALHDISASGEEMKLTFLRITLVGMVALLVMLALSSLSAYYLSRQLSMVLNALNGLARSPDQAFDIESLAVLRRKGSWWFSEINTAVLRFAEEIRERRHAEARLERQHKVLAESEANAHAQRHFLRTLIRTIPDLVWLKDKDGVFLLCNPRFEQLAGKSEAEILGKTDYDLVSKELADFFRTNDLAALSANAPLTNEEELTFVDDGHKEWLLTTKTAMLDAHGEVIGVLGIGRDMSMVKAAEEAMRVSIDKLNEAQRIARLGSWTLDLRNNRLEMSDEGFRIFETERELFRATYETLLDAIHPDDREAVDAAYMDSRQACATFEVTHRLLMPDGRIKYVQSHCETLFDADGNPTVSHGTTQDISELKRAEERIHHLINYDALTGLPNRSLLSERLVQCIAAGALRPRCSAMILLNIDRFKNINDARGMALGDRLLQAIAQRLKAVVRDGDIVARLSADEFAILLPDMETHSAPGGRQALTVGEKLLATMRQSFIIDGDEVAITASLGITLFPEDGDDTQGAILRRADMALHRAKAAGGNQCVFFEIGMDDAILQRFTIETGLRRGIPAGELRLYLQPQVDDKKRVVGAEALVRWQHPQRGLLQPGVFIPIAEESDLIVDLGAWVMAESCRLMAQEKMAGNHLRLSVNLSPRQFRQPGFVPWMRDLLTTTGADPSHLTLEVTEGLVIDNVGDVVSKMSDLTALGIHFSLDDFGTGYSSLGYLKRLPIHELKIDKSFVQDAPDNPHDAALVETILEVARHMHLTVVAEGVETQAQADFLNARATLIHQGYLYGKPEAAEVWLERWRLTKLGLVGQGGDDVGEGVLDI